MSKRTRQYIGILEAGTAYLPTVFCQTIEGKRNYKKPLLKNH